MIKVLKFSSLAEANFMMNGGIVGTHLPPPFIPGVVGNTLTFTTPSGNKTFTQVAAEPAGMISFGSFKSQLEAAVTNLQVRLVDGKVAFSHATPGSAVVISNANEPIKSVLGFDNATSISGQFLNGPGGAAPKAHDMNVEDGKIYMMVEV